MRALIAAVLKALFEAIFAPNAAREAEARGRAEQQYDDSRTSLQEVADALAAGRASDAHAAAAPDSVRAPDPYSRD